MGIVQREASIDWATAEPQVAVWVEHHPKATEVRRQLIEAAAGGKRGRRVAALLGRAIGRC